MKTKIPYSTPDRSLVWICLIVANAIVFTSMKLSESILKPWVTKQSLVMKILSLFGMIIIPTIVVTLILFVIGKLAGLDTKIANYLEEQARRQKEKLTNKLTEARGAYKTLVHQAKEMYSISEIRLGDQIFSFFLILNEKIEIIAPPVVKLNGQKIASDIIDDYTIRCYLRKTVTAEEKDLRFSIGNRFVEVDNPYYMPSDTNALIVWQCKGHEYERKIYLPINYFPNVRKGCEYEFTLKIDGVSFGLFKGKYDNQSYGIVIPLSKSINPSDCISKKVALYVTFGKGNKIALPPPTVLTIEGRPTTFVD